VKKTWPIVDASSASQGFAYDLNGNLQREILEDGATKTHSFDSLNRKIKTIYAGGASTVPHEIAETNLTYDANGNVLSMADTLVNSSVKTESMSYDARNRVLTRTDRNGRSQSFTYDDRNARLSLTNHQNQTVSYEYDARGRLAKVITPELGQTTYTIDAADRPLVTTFANAATSTFAYDTAGRVASKSHVRGGGTIQSETYTYDANSNRLTQVINDGTSSSTSYTYDDSDRLKSEKRSDVENVDSFDAAGNPTSRIVKNGAGVVQKTLTYTVNARDQITAVTSVPAGTIESYQFDARGNRTQSTINGVIGSFMYDRMNRIVDQTQSGLTTQFDLDAADRRASQVVSGLETQFQWDGIRLQSESSSSGVIGSTYRWGMELIGQAIGGQARTILVDTQQSPVAIIDAGGSTSDRYRYSAHGELINRTGSSAQPIRFGGYLSQDGTDELYAYARTYSPGLGRFNQVDPVTQFDALMPMGAHRYVYGFGSPLVYRDPDGRQVCGAACAFGYNMQYDQANQDKHYRALANSTPLIGVPVGAAIAAGNAAEPFTDALNLYDDPGAGARTSARVEAMGSALWERAEKVVAASALPIIGPMALGSYDTVQTFDSIGTGLGESAAETVTSYEKGDYVGAGAGGAKFTGNAAAAVSIAVPAARGIGPLVRPRVITPGMTSTKTTVVGESSSGPKIVACAAGSCFVAGTLVHTAEGYKPIEQVQVGELVASRNELTGESTWRRVEQVIITTDREVWDYVFVDDQGNQEILGATPNHPFHTPNGAWVDVGALVIGAEVSSLDGRKLTLVSKTMRDAGQTTYNFEVAEDHNYFVGTLGFWVHNGGPGDCCPTANKIADVVDGGRHRETKIDGKLNGTESHHLIADVSSDIATNDALAIRMLREDHVQTGSWGSRKTSRAFQSKQLSLIAEGKYAEALQMGIDDVMELFDKKYDSHIQSAIESAPKNSDGSIDWTKFKKKETSQ
jgi:RHS repeat-associated protein